MPGSEVKELFMEGIYSQVGRTSGEHLNSLRQQLGVGCDPAYDYSEIEQRHHDLARKKQKSVDEEPPAEPSGPLAELEQALKVAEKAQELEEDSACRPATPPIIRHRRKVKNDPSFTVQSRDEMYEHLVKHQFHPPPPGTYRPRDKFPEHLPPTKVRNPITDFNVKPKNQNKKKIKEREEWEKSDNPDPNYWKIQPVSVELLEDFNFSTLGPEKPQRKLGCRSMSQMLPRPALEKTSNITFNISSCPLEKQLQGDKDLSTLKRVPEWDFGSTQGRGKDLVVDSFFQPGQYKPNYNSVIARSDITGMPFEKQFARPNPGTGSGRDKPAKEGSYGKSLIPDRSLHRRTSVLSSIPRSKSCDFTNGLKRQPMAKLITYYREDNPKVVEAVMKRMMETDWHDQFKKVAARPDIGPTYARSIRREQAILGIRAFGTDPGMQAARFPKPPTATEQLTVEEVDSALLRRRIPQKDMTLMAERHPTKKHIELPPRNKEPAAPKFIRSLHETESRPDLLGLSFSNKDVQECRNERSFVPLHDWADFAAETV